MNSATVAPCRMPWFVMTRWADALERVRSLSLDDVCVCVIVLNAETKAVTVDIGQCELATALVGSSVLGVVPYGTRVSVNRIPPRSGTSAFSTADAESLDWLRSSSVPVVLLKEQ